MSASRGPADLAGELGGVVGDDGKVVEGMQEPDTAWQLARVGPKGDGDVAGPYRHCAAVHHHQPHPLTGVHNHTIACRSG